MDIISVDGFFNSFKPRRNFIKTATPKRSSIFKRVRAAKMNLPKIVSSGGLFNSAKPKRISPQRMAMLERYAQQDRKTAEFKAEQLRRKAEQLRRNAIAEELKTKISRQKETNYQNLFARAQAGAKRYGADSLSRKGFARIQRERAMGLR